MGVGMRCSRAPRVALFRMFAPKSPTILTPLGHPHAFAIRADMLAWTQAEGAFPQTTADRTGIDVIGPATVRIRKPGFAVARRTDDPAVLGFRHRRAHGSGWDGFDDQRLGFKSRPILRRIGVIQAVAAIHRQENQQKIQQEFQMSNV